MPEISLAEGECREFMLFMKMFQLKVV